MNYNVLAIDDKKLKYEITDVVLRALPDWFGIKRPSSSTPKTRRT